MSSKDVLSCNGILQRSGVIYNSSVGGGAVWHSISVSWFGFPSGQSSFLSLRSQWIGTWLALEGKDAELSIGCPTHIMIKAEYAFKLPLRYPLEVEFKTHPKRDWLMSFFDLFILQGQWVAISAGVVCTILIQSKSSSSEWLLRDLSWWRASTLGSEASPKPPAPSRLRYTIGVSTCERSVVVLWHSVGQKFRYLRWKKSKNTKRLNSHTDKTVLHLPLFPIQALLSLIKFLLYLKYSEWKNSLFRCFLKQPPFSEAFLHILVANSE